MKASSTFQLPGGGTSISFQVLREKLEAVFQRKKSLFFNSISLIAGFILGFAASIGLGGDRQVSIIVGLAVAVGVLLSGSVVGYLVLQTFALGLLAALAYVAFRINSTFSFWIQRFVSAKCAMYILHILFIIQWFCFRKYDFPELARSDQTV
jgi:hypothetical protein